MTTGQRIKAARKKAGITQAKLAEWLNVPYQSISQWERDVRNPKYETLKRIAAALGMDWMELVPEDKQGEVIIDHMKTKIAGITGNEVYVDPDDEDFLKNVLPHIAAPDPLSEEEAALKTLLNSMGYDIIKIRGEFFFTHNSGGSKISTDDLNELLSCAQNGLKVAAKTLELKLLQKARERIEGLSEIPRYQKSPETPPEAPPAEEGKTTPEDG